VQLQVDGYGAAQRSLSWRSVVFGVIGALAGLWGAFWTFVFVAHWAGTPDIRKDLGLEIAGSIIIGIAPTAAGAYLLWRALRAYTRLRRLRHLAAAAWAGVPLQRQPLAGALRLRAAQVDALLIDAVELGALVDAAPYGGYPPVPPPAPAMRPPMMAPMLAATMPAAPPGPAPQPWALPEAAVTHGPWMSGPAAYAGASAVRFGAPQAGSAPLAGGRDGLVGRTLGSYRVTGFVAAGGMGAVYAAEHIRTGGTYALKVLHLDRRTSPEARRRFEREARAAGAIGHPGIAAVHDFDTTPDGVTFLVMELLHGETLEQRLERVGTLPWPAALAVTSDVGSALSAAHAAGFLHRDLKPSNVFFARGGAAGAERTVLLDFGLAKPLDAAASRVTVTGAAAGTPLYMPPEQARGEPVDVRADVYGLAAVLFEMVTGAPPFHDVNLATVYARLLGEPAPAPSRLAPCPPALDAIMARALAKVPNERFPDVGSFIVAIRGAQFA
jgi:serine/threonine-protein kinase